MHIFVLNCGSSSLKFQVVQAIEGLPMEAIAHGQVKHIGKTADLELHKSGQVFNEQQSMCDHEAAVRWALEHLDREAFRAVGHRIVHGGDKYRESVPIDEAVIGDLQQLSELAPLHNPACVAGIRAARACLGIAIPMVAVFDTAFHHTMPKYASLYALPLSLSEKHAVRRYGF